MAVTFALVCEYLPFQNSTSKPVIEAWQRHTSPLTRQEEIHVCETLLRCSERCRKKKYYFPLACLECF